MDINSNIPPDTDSRKKTLSVQYTACIVLFALIFLLDLCIPSGVAVGVLYAVVVLLTLWIPQGRTTLIFALVSSFLIVAVLFYKPLAPEMWKVFFNRGIALFAVWATAMLCIKRNKTEQQRKMILIEREKALDEIKILRGLLPICASCKKIKDDEGYWIQIEGYIKNHSEAEFTHGICPDCVEKLYPDFFNASDYYKEK
jgi:hypothetical protein